MRCRRRLKKGDVLQVRRCLSSGLDPNLSHRFGASLLMLAAQEGNTAIGRELILRGAHLDARDKHGWTALCAAIHAGHIGFVQLLLNAGAALDKQGFAGGSIESFLEWSIKYGGSSKESIKRRMKPLIESARSSRPHSSAGKSE